MNAVLCEMELLTIELDDGAGRKVHLRSGQVQEPHQHHDGIPHSQSPQPDDERRRRASILGTLDAVHRSLLLNNIRYECDNGPPPITNLDHDPDPIAPINHHIETAVHNRNPSNRPQLLDTVTTPANKPHIPTFDVCDGGNEAEDDDGIITIMRNPALCSGKSGTAASRKQQPQVHNNDDEQQHCDHHHQHHQHHHHQTSITSSSRSHSDHSTTTLTTNSSYRSSSSSSKSHHHHRRHHHHHGSHSTAETSAEERSAASTSGTMRRRSKSGHRKHSSAKVDEEAPMLRIVQEMSERRAVVVSTIEVNRSKVRRWQKQDDDDDKATPCCKSTRHKSAGDAKRRQNGSRQRYISENFCNEYLDKNHSPEHGSGIVYTSSDEEADKSPETSTTRRHASDRTTTATQINNNTTVPVPPECRQAPITFGKLQASPLALAGGLSGGGGTRRVRPPAAGRLMAKRLARHSQDVMAKAPAPANRRHHHLASDEVPPAKPPRTFSSYTPSPAASVASEPELQQQQPPTQQRQHAAPDSISTLRVGDATQGGRGGKLVGWQLPETQDQAPSAPIERSKHPKPATIGWAPQQAQARQQPTQQLHHPPGTWTPPPKSAIQQPTQSQPKQPQPPQQIPQEIFDMLYYDSETKKTDAPSMPTQQRPPLAIMTATQRAMPQSPPREYIDDVDSPVSTHRAPATTRAAVQPAPPPAFATSADKHMHRFATGTVFSTPQRKSAHHRAEHLDAIRRAVEANPTAPDLDDIERQIIPHESVVVSPQQPKQPTAQQQHSQSQHENCPCCGHKPQQKKSFGKLALRRTKTFLEAGRHMLNRKAANQSQQFVRRCESHPPQRPHSDIELEWQLPQTPPQPQAGALAKSDATVQKNREPLSHAKRTSKYLNLDERQVFSDGGGDADVDCQMESPREIYERFLVYREQQLQNRPQAPPQKPARALQANKTNRQPDQQNDFDFQRSVASPKSSATRRQSPANIGSPSKAGALLLLPKRLFDSATGRRSTTADMNIVPQQQPPPKKQSPSYKSYRDEAADDGFAVFMAEYLRRMYEKMEQENGGGGGKRSTVLSVPPPITAEEEDAFVEDFVQLRDASDSECSNGVDVAPDNGRYVAEQQMAEEPLYSEIQRINSDRSPQKPQPPAPLPPVYAQVNKATSTSTATPPVELHSSSLFNQSVDSLCLLNNTDDHDLVHSIEDFLGAQLLAGLRPKVPQEFKSLSEVMSRPPSGMRESKSVNDLEALANTEATQTPPMGHYKILATPGNVRDSPPRCEESRQRSASAAVCPSQPQAQRQATSNDEVEIYADLTSEPTLFCTAVEVHSAQRNESSDSSSDEDGKQFVTLPPPAQQQSAIEVEDDRTSTYSSIVLTESICDEVLRGERINDDICATMNRLQGALERTAGGGHLDATQAEPESSLGGEEDDDDLYETGRQSSTTLPTGTGAGAAAAAAVPKYRQFADSVRNSLRSSSRFFKSTSSASSSSKSLASATAQRRSPSADKLRSDPATTSYMHRLHEQCAHQRLLRPQLMQAIGMCRQSPNLGVGGGSAELVEAERLLLLSHAKEQAARGEMQRIDYDDRVPVEKRGKRGGGAGALGTAMLEIRRLEVRGAVQQQQQRDSGEDARQSCYFVCVCSYRNQVLATGAVRGADDQSDANGDGRVVFDRMELRFVDLQPNFQLKVEVFALRLPHYATQSMASNEAPDASRFRPVDVAFATPSNLWPISAAGIHRYGAGAGHTQLRTHTRRYEFPQCTTVSASSCIFSATERECLVPFASAEPFASHARAAARSTPMADRPLRVDFYSEILLDIPELQGFLHVKRGRKEEGEEEEEWSRQWCWIRGCKLYMSLARQPAMTPTKALDGQQPMPPALHTIDLTHCISDRLIVRELPAEEEFHHRVSIECLLDVDAESSNEPSIVYQLASQAAGDLPVWVRELNRVLEFVRDWRL